MAVNTSYGGTQYYAQQLAQARANANHFESLYRKGDRRPAIMYARAKWADQFRNLNKNVAVYDQRWINQGRPGALEALQKKYPTQDALSASGKLSVFDPQGGVEQLNAKRTLDQNLINLTNSENLLNQQYTTSKSDYQAKVPQLARQLLSNFAGRGMGFSSSYGQAVGEQNADIARGLSNLDLQRQQQMADITSQRGLANSGYKNDLAASIVGTVNRLSARAGTLGFQPKGTDIFNDPTLLVALAKKLLGGK
jgi:hypothetical protein